jgi:hypothetical protein
VLIIRTEQMEALRGALFERANARLAEYARERFPSVCAQSSDADLQALAARMRQRAASLALAREDQVATFVDLAIMYGEDFADQAWAAAILKQSDLPPATRLVTLVRRLRANGIDL